jgi:hypothetical protein
MKEKTPHAIGATGVQGCVYPGLPRYPHANVQDPKEDGLSLLRAQYENAAKAYGYDSPAQIRIGWGDVMERKANELQLFGLPDGVSVKFSGEAAKLTAIMTLMCRATSLAWLMMEELERTSDSIGPVVKP